MADLAQVLATGGTALVSAATGAGLTYWLGALNRRHQEAREDRTRWYEARLRAYLDYHNVVWEAFFRTREKQPSRQGGLRLIQKILYPLGTIHLVGSPEVIGAAERIFQLTLKGLAEEEQHEYVDELESFQTLARKDLGH